MVTVKFWVWVFVVTALVTTLFFHFFMSSFIFLLYSNITKITDDDGIASLIYTGVGNGDITISANINGLSDNIGIEDCIWWDTGKTNKLTQYRWIDNNVISSYYGQEADYYIKATGGGSKFYLPVEESSHCVFEADITLISSTSWTDGLFAFNKLVGTAQYPRVDILQYGAKYGTAKTNNSNTWQDVSRKNGILPMNTWYTFKLEINGTTVHTSIIRKEDGEVLFNYQGNIGLTCTPYFGFYNQPQSSFKFKNIKLKKLTS